MDPPEELRLNASRIDSEVFKAALPSVFQFIPSKELLTYRRVCKTWDQVVQKDCSKGPSYTFKLCNNPVSIEAFKNLTFPVKQFNFENMDLEKNILENQDIFRRFTMNHCLTMTDLSIYGCNLSTGRFFELLAFCKNLKKLLLRETPSIFALDAGIGIIHWGFCFKHVRENLSQLRKLAIEGKVLKNNDVWGLGIGIRNLKHLQIGCSYNLPTQGVNELLKNSSHSLMTLFLRGAIVSPGLNIGAETEMESLQKLSLVRTKIDSLAVKQLDTFLAKCPCLTEFRISQSVIRQKTLSTIMTKLVSLELLDCSLEGNTFDKAYFPNLQILKVHTQLPPNSDVASKLELAMMGLAKCPKPKLSNLELQLVTNGSEYLKYLKVANFKTLTTLSLVNSVDIAGQQLRNIFRELTSLSSLSITKCPELTDENVCCVPSRNVDESLANLINLKSLNLSETSVGNITVHECIVKMKQLEHIILNKTKVDESGLLDIVNASSQRLNSSLKFVSVLPCRISNVNYKTLIRKTPNVVIECLIDT